MLLSLAGASLNARRVIDILLECFGPSYNPIKILEREQYWKSYLDTIKNQYNDN
jgi:hypothetical protein